jgi:tetratricopeptide (TPR) repeat protein
MLAVVGTALAEDADEMHAREQFRVGQTAYSRGEYAKALTAFSEAYGLQPAPGLLFNIAQCHRKLGNYERAAVFYRQYLELSPSSENSARVRALLTEVQASEKGRKRRAVEQAKLLPVQPTAGDPSSPLQKALSGNGTASEVVRPASDDTIFTKWWFWTGVSAIAVGSTVYLLANSHSPEPSFGAVNTLRR